MSRQSEEILILREIMLYTMLSTTNILFLPIIYQTPSRNSRSRGSLSLPPASAFSIKLDVHESAHRDATMKITNKMHYID
jgi:hypothetical protein